MPRLMLSVHDVDKNSRGWTVLIQVVERSNIQTSRGTPPKKMRRFLFTDSQGTKVSAIMYDNCIRLFYNFLWPFKRYYISNAYVNFSPLPFRVGDYAYSWIINSTTLVEAHNEPIPPTLPCAFQFTKFAHLHKYADTDVLQNIKAIAIHALPKKQHGSGATTRDIVVVNEEKKLMLLTLWNEFEEDEGTKIANTIAAVPMIIGMRLKVTTFNALSLASRLSSCFLLNPPLPDDMNMKKWYAANKEDLKNLLEAKTYKDPTFLLPLSEEDQILTIKSAKDAFEAKQQRAAWVRGDTRLIPGQTKFWYTSCVNCQKSINADMDWDIICPSCKEHSQTEIRCRIGIVLSDPTASVNCVIFGQDAEKLIPFTAVKLKQEDESGASLDIELAESIKKHTIVCFLRTYDVEFQGQTQKRHSILKAYTIDEYLTLPLPINHGETSTASPSIATPVAIGEKITTKQQMFTPTTKSVLEEIAGTAYGPKIGPSTSAGTKRALVFKDNSHEVLDLPAEITLPTATEKQTDMLSQLTSAPEGRSSKAVERSLLKKAKDSH